MELRVSKRHHLENVQIKLSGAKNALLHLLFASILPRTKTTFSNVPTSLHDYHAVCDILNSIGAKTTAISEHVVQVAPLDKLKNVSVPLEYTRRTRTSLMLLGGLAKKVGRLTIGYPGGCAFSDQRPFDIHLAGLESLGAKIEHDEYHISIEHFEDKDAGHTLRYPSVGASINLMLYSTIGSNTATLQNIAIEPEVIEVASFLNQCGGHIRIDHLNRTMTIKGVPELHGVNFSVMYDRIQTMTYAALAYLHKINVEIKGVDTKAYIEAPLKIISDMGGKWEIDPAQHKISFFGKESQLIPTTITAQPFPEFPTDLQPIFAVLCTQANGTSYITDTVYPERVKYVKELKKLNFPIDAKNNKIRIQQISSHDFHATTMKSYDLRAGMAVIMAASLSEQVCTISSAQQVFRGYENLLENMTNFMHISIAHEG